MTNSDNVICIKLPVSVTIGTNNVIHPHTVLDGPITIQNDNIISGTISSQTPLTIGSGNVFECQCGKHHLN